MENVCMNYNRQVYIHMYIFGCMYRTSPPRGRTYTQGPAQARADTCAHAHASAVPPRTTGRAASKPRPSASAMVRAGGAGSGAYLVQRGDGRGVPRADVGVESRRRLERLRAEAGRGPRRRAGLARFRVTGSGRARSTSPPTRAHAANLSPSHTGARIHNPDRFSHT
jgi:hypothetical protein